MEDSDNTVAIAALIVAICSAAVTLGGLVWQLVLYRLQGARLRVQLLLRYRGDRGTTTIAEGRKPPSWAAMQEKLGLEVSPIGIEFALIRVTNVGRTPVSVESINLDIGRYGLFRSGRYAVEPMQFRDHLDDEWKPIDTREPLRIEPGANISVPVHIWPALTSDHVRGHRGNRPLIVRGSATAVGRRPTLSARRNAWRVPKDAASRFRDYMPPREAFVYRVLWEECYTAWTGKAPLIWARDVLKRLADGADVEDLKNLLDERNKDGIHHLVALRAHREFHNAPTEPPQRRRVTLHRILWGVEA